ncbi:MAG: SbcC/MukB-like Walker B domain-containing protein [Clostridia bacterium]
MKKLTRLLLIHWHYFTHETVSFEMLNFLTGKNASGKSTIIDAMQLVLLGDTSGSYFNKAASGRGNRSLMGYLKGELGDNEDSGFRYLRNGRFTSYVALEFLDEEKKKYFTAGCCFDVYSENDMQKLFFLFDGEFPQNEFVEDSVPWEIRKLRDFLKSEYPNHKTTDVGREFRTTLYGKMGGLRDRFGSLLKKAVSFNPNVDIQDFISEFVCDTQQTVDVSQMQENIRSYKRLEEEAGILQEKIVRLDQIMTEHGNYLRAKQDGQIYAYLIDCAQQDMKIAELEKERKNEENLLSELRTVTSMIEDARNRLAQLREESNQLQARLINNETEQAIKHLEAELAEKEAQIRDILSYYEKAASRLSRYVSNWSGCVTGMIDKLASIPNDDIDASLISRIHDMAEEGNAFLKQADCLKTIDEDTILAVGETGMQALATLVQSLTDHAIELGLRVEDEQKRLATRRASLQQEQKSLENGIFPFPQDALDLKCAIASRLRTLARQEVKVVIVAEAAEIQNDRWRNAIEGYLNTQKYYIIVPDQYFRDALRVFDTMKRSKRLYGTGLIDIEKIRRKNPSIDPGCLAEEMQTDDPLVRVFLNYTLGWVHKCETVNELRRFNTSITDDGMLYQNYVVRAMNPERWAKPAIGQSAIYRRLDAVKAELVLLSNQIIACAMVKSGIDLRGKLTVPGESDIQQAVVYAEEKKTIPALAQEVIRLRASRDAIDTSAIDALKDHLARLNDDIKALDADLLDKNRHQAITQDHLHTCRDKTIPTLERDVQALRSVLVQKYDPEWVENTAVLRYQRELSIRRSAEEIFRAFPRELSRSTNAKNAAWEHLVELRQDYNRRYIMGYDTKSETDDAYEDAWVELSENKLPEYVARIEDTRQKAFEQFREDFLSRLENNIRDADTQISGLNAAIKGSFFGEESFRFKIIPRPEYKRYYDMLTDPMKIEGGYNLFSEQFNLKYKDEIAELFAIITNEDGNGSVREKSDYEKRVQMFTDFRTYLTFDLESVNRDGESQRLSRTMGKKSGGETQTPFYVAVLASFAQLYRAGRDKTQNTARLIIFDEAFSKMDGERIIRSVQLLRQFHFQVILSAPTEKVGDIGTLVDRNLCVLREGKRTCVRAFDPRKAEWLENE